MAGILSPVQHRMKMILLLALFLELALGASLGSSGDRNGPKFEYGGRDDGHHFVTFNYGSDGVYKFAFKLPDQTRQEERNEEGEVRGSYSFIDPEGEEFSLQYLADKGGFQPVADHLPVAPEETDDVKEARKAFAEFYEETVKYLEALGSKEGSDEDGGRRYKSPSSDQAAAGSYQSLGGSYGSKGPYEASRLGDIEDDDDDEEDSSSEEEDGEEEDGDEEDSSEEEGGDGEEDSSEEDEEEDEEEEEEEEEKKGGKRGDRDGRRSGKKDKEEEEEEEEEEEKKSGGRKGDRDGRRNGKKNEEEEEEEGGDEEKEKKEEKEKENERSNRREEERISRNDRKRSKSGRGNDKRRE